MGGVIITEFGMKRYILLYFKWITNKALLYSTGNSVQCYVAAWMGGEFGGERIHIYVWLNPFTIHLKLSQHCSSVILQCKIKHVKRKKEKKWRALSHNHCSCMGFKLCILRTEEVTKTEVGTGSSF